MSSPRQTQPGTEQESPAPAPVPPGSAPAPTSQPHPVDESRPLGRILLFGIQHVLVMAATPISAIFLMSATLHLDPGLTVNLLSAAFVLSGVGSLIQSLGPWKFGPRLPFVMLPGGAPLILFIAIAEQHGLRTATGAVILTAAFYFVVLPVFSRLLAFFPALVIGTMIVIVGVNLVKVGAVLVTGRPGQPGFADPLNLGLGMATIGFTVAFYLLFSGILRQLAVMLGLLAGTALAAFLGSVDLGRAADGGLFTVPQLMPFGSPQFNLVAALPLMLYSLASMAEATGQTVINAEAVGKEIDKRTDVPKTVRGDALTSLFGGFFGLPLMVTSGENIGIVRVTGVRSRFVTAAAGVVLIVIGFLAPVTRAISVIPSAVVGGTAMVVFAKRVAHLAEVTAVTDPDGTSVIYRVTGELFFASSNDLVGRFDYARDPDKVVIDLSAAHIWDASSVAALDAIETKYAQRGKTVRITGLNEPSARIHDTLSGELTGHH